MLPHSWITTYTDTNYLCLLSVCSVAGNLIGNTGRNGHTIIALHILISIVSTTMGGNCCFAESMAEAIIGIIDYRGHIGMVLRGKQDWVP